MITVVADVVTDGVCVFVTDVFVVFFFCKCYCYFSRYWINTVIFVVVFLLLLLFFFSTGVAFVVFVIVIIVIAIVIVLCGYCC